jgi:hypothetical protein
MRKAVCYFGMIVRQMYECVLLESSTGHADMNMNLRRKFDRYIVTMAGLTTSVAKSVAKLSEAGMRLSSNDCRNLDISCWRSLGSLLVSTIYSMVQDLEVTTMSMVMTMQRTRLRSSSRQTSLKPDSSIHIFV